jgi:hypothetical protein
MVETWQQIALGVLVLLVFTSFIKEWVSPEVVALGALVTCVLIGVLPIAVPSPAPGLEGRGFDERLAEIQRRCFKSFCSSSADYGSLHVCAECRFGANGSY